jgi:hypothetical protein
MLNRAVVAAFIANTAAAFGLQRSQSGDLASAALAENRTGSVEGPRQMTSDRRAAIQTGQSRVGRSRDARGPSRDRTTRRATVRSA